MTCSSGRTEGFTSPRSRGATGWSTRGSESVRPLAGGRLLRLFSAVPLLLLLCARDARPAALPPATVEIEETGGYRYIRSNGIPDHPTGEFPNRNNPNAITEQRHEFRVTLSPRPASRVTRRNLEPFGVARNGIPFDPGAAEFWRHDFGSGWQYEAMGGTLNLGVDSQNAHVQPSGAYHYHGLPVGLIRNLGGERRPVVLGWAADGFEIYGEICGGPVAAGDLSAVRGRVVRSCYRLRRGSRPGGDEGPGGRYDGTFGADYEHVESLGELDECNGHTAPTPDHPEGVYHYHLTSDYPFIPRALRGEPDPSFGHARGGRRGGPRGGPHGGPPGGHPPPHHPPGFGPPPGHPPPLDRFR